MIAKLSLLGITGSVVLSSIGYIGHVTAHAWVETEKDVAAEASKRWAHLVHTVATARGYELAVPETTADWRVIADQAAKENNLDRCLVRAVISVETGHGRNFISPAGAVGHMQLMPGTAKDFGITNDVDRMDPLKNIPAGAAYLKQLTDQFGLTNGIAAYNAGPGRVAGAMKEAKSKQFEAFKRVLKPETQNYVPSVISKMNECERWQ